MDTLNLVLDFGEPVKPKRGVKADSRQTSSDEAPNICFNKKEKNSIFPNMSLYAKHINILLKAVRAVQERTFFAQYPDHPKAYGANAISLGKEAYKSSLGKPFEQLLQGPNEGTSGEEQSPFTGEQLGVSYPTYTVDTLIERAEATQKQWRNLPIGERAGILIESLERSTERFHEIALATQHTTGQSYVMSFQASGPHAADRALEALAIGYQELTRFPEKVKWVKPMGKRQAHLDKTFKAIPKGLGLVIGCATFPTWNTLPGLYANLITGNPSIVKPHPHSVLPIAIYIAELQKVLQENGFDPQIVQLAVDSSDQLITKELAEHPAIKLIDFTGSTQFGEYIESLPNKTVFTEKAGVNSVIIDSAKDMREVMRNLAFSVCLYSGQMCTAPQNFFIPATGVKTDAEHMSYEQVVDLFQNEVAALALHPKMGAGTLGALQNESTLKRAQNAKNMEGNVVLEAPTVKSEEFAKARIFAPTIIEVDADKAELYNQELFGPILLVIKTKDTEHSVELAQKLVREKGALTCAVYCSDSAKADAITDAMNEVFVPVTLNLTGFWFVNQHAAFSDFHGTGGTPAGNASYADPSFVNRRFVWIGNRTPSK